jgi:polyhydroxybutyrate depolymerase
MAESSQAITVGGVRRSYLLAEPAGAASAIVLSLHGSRSTALRQARLSQLATLAEAAGAVVAFPEATVPAGSGYRWDDDTDTDYLARLVDELRARYPTPAGRVCVTGMSGGARMACQFAWTHADVVTMVGAVAGLRAAEGSPPSRPVPVIAFHGTADRINPYNGGRTPRWDESVPEAARRWAAANRQPAPPEVVGVSSTLTRLTYGSQGAPGEVTLWTARGAGHTWPGAHMGVLFRVLLGRTTSEIDATAELWAFAERHAGDP